MSVKRFKTTNEVLDYIDSNSQDKVLKTVSREDLLRTLDMVRCQFDDLNNDYTDQSILVNDLRESNALFTKCVEKYKTNWFIWFTYSMLISILFIITFVFTTG